MDNVFDTFIVAIKNGSDYLYMDGSNKYGYFNLLPPELSVEKALMTPKKGPTSFVNLEYSGTLYSSTGQRIKKISKSDLEYTEYSESLADDDATYYYIPTYGHYPYTIVYEWEVNYKNGYISYPLFCPIDRTKQSIERSSYTLQLPVGNNYKSYAQNLTFHKDQKTLKNLKTETWNS